MQLFGTVIVAAILVCSIASYRHNPSEYRAGKSIRIAALPGFGFLFRTIQAFTLVISILSFNVHHWTLLQLDLGLGLRMTGLILAMAAMFAFAWAKRSLGTSYSPSFDSYVSLEVVSRGPYRWVRHPIYSANLAALAGLSLATGSLWIVTCLFIVAAYYLTSAGYEEEALTSTLPGYGNYVARTSRFVPGLI